MTQSKHDSRMPLLYGVYLLRSLTKQNSFYIGSTPNPYRRLRQHNGELSQGGAWRTKKKGYRPWRMVIYVHGFPSNISALQFEHAWQHAYRTRHIPVEKRRHNGKKNTGSGTTVHEKVANCRLLLGSGSFSRLGLKVTIFNRDIYDVWLTNKFQIDIPDYILLEIRVDDAIDQRLIEGGNYEQVKSFMSDIQKMEEQYTDESIETLKQQQEQHLCCICEMPLDVESDVICFCFHKECTAIYHCACWSKLIMLENPTQEMAPVLPIRGKCCQCGKVNFWNMVVRNAQTVKERCRKKDYLFTA
ncbi:hypothetical protein FOA43_000078 [Brettanomyces nanus]|uniref:GIY-YIG domain-containing protein n=1 Tax=Eeniella nana TaxID=13502 RepID=A0A875RSR0_EENNA|nr:uncharacterized protein FOA43_000078 [Brettanomyces nanus]QPG72777.1 hypothetical protein FOA43_000078 [Brettanomyces nanus]